MSVLVVHDPVTVESRGRIWLRHTTNPDLSMAVTVATLDSMTQPITQTVLYVLGRSRPIVVNDGARKSRQGSISVVLHSPAERSRWVALTLDGTPLYFACPAAWGWEFTSAYMSLGLITWTNPAGIGYKPFRIVSAPYTLVDAPAVTPGPAVPVAY